MRCGKSTCRCARAGGELHGPYWYLYWMKEWFGSIQLDGLVISTDGASRIALERESIALIKPIICRHLPKCRGTKEIKLRAATPP